MKILYLVATTRRKNRGNLTGKTNGWKTTLNTLTVHYGDRIIRRMWRDETARNHTLTLAA